MSVLCSTADAVSSGYWPILFKVLTLNVNICFALLHLSNFCLCLNSVADFSNPGTRDLTSAETRPFLTLAKDDAVWIHGLSESHCKLSIAVF